SAVVAVYEPRRFFGTRVMERFAPYVALFALAYARFAEREARTRRCVRSRMSRSACTAST
ncbi:MAG: hypothetical protein ACREMU_06125, partial [Gemmatimonadaceae bacterium]